MYQADYLSAQQGRPVPARQTFLHIVSVELFNNGPILFSNKYKNQPCQISSYARSLAR